MVEDEREKVLGERLKVKGIRKNIWLLIKKLSKEGEQK